MIGSPENNFQTMQPPQQEPNPRNAMLGKALANSPNTQARQPLADRSIQGYTQPTQTWQPTMMSANQYGSPTPQMASWQQPQSNASFNMQPMIPNDSGVPQGPIDMNQQGVNRFGVGLARPMPQNTQLGQ